MKPRCALRVASALVLPFTATAQPVSGLYVSAGVGVNLAQDETVKSIDGSTASGSLGSRIGPAAIASVGWGFGNGLRGD